MVRYQCQTVIILHFPTMKVIRITLGIVMSSWFFFLGWRLLAVCWLADHFSKNNIHLTPCTSDCPLGWNGGLHGTWWLATPPPLPWNSTLLVSLTLLCTPLTSRIIFSMSPYLNIGGCWGLESDNHVSFLCGFWINGELDRGGRWNNIPVLL